MVVASSSTAQGGRYVVQSSGSGTGRVTYRFTAPVAASYALAYRAIAPSTSSDEFTYALDGGSTRVVTVPSSARTNWTWVNGPTLNLSAGSQWTSPATLAWLSWRIAAVTRKLCCPITTLKKSGI